MNMRSNVHVNHRKRMRERVEREGIFSLTPHEVLEVFLFDVIPRCNTNPTSHLLIEKFGSLYGVFTAPYEELIKIDGVGSKTARHITDSFKSYLEECEREMLDKPMCSLATVSNYLLLHRIRDDSLPITVLFMDDGMKVEKVIDTDGMEKFAEEEFAGFGVIIASDVSVLDDVLGFDPENCEIIDVLAIDGYEVKSCVKFTS